MRMNRTGTRLCVALTPLAACALPILATAQEAPSGAPSDPAIVERMRQCSAIADDGARLGCFDAVSTTLLAEFDRGQVRLVRTEEIEKTRRNAFGFSLPTITLFGGNDKDGEEVEALDVLNSTITSVSRLGEDSWRFTIAEGDAVWEVRDAPSRFREPRVGDSVEFEKAALGSYWVRVNGRMGTKGSRVR